MINRHIIFVLCNFLNIGRNTIVPAKLSTTHNSSHDKGITVRMTKKYRNNQTTAHAVQEIAAAAAPSTAAPLTAAPSAPSKVAAPSTTAAAAAPSTAAPLTAAPSTVAPSAPSRVAAAAAEAAAAAAAAAATASTVEEAALAIVGDFINAAAGAAIK